MKELSNNTKVKLIVENIPEEIKDLPQWLVWKGVLKENNKLSKIPINPLNGSYAETDNPETWGTFEESLAYYEQNNLFGVGFVFTADDSFVGIDLDNCIEPETGEITPDALKIVNLFNSYTEISPSGNGLHILVKGNLPGDKRRKGKIEVYDRLRYFTVTGELYENAPIEINNRDNELNEFYKKYFANEDRKKADAVRSYDEGNQIIKKAMASKNGHKFKSLWQGDLFSYQSQSEADLALCRLLAFWTNNDKQQIDNLFRKSGLYRQKWDERHFSSGMTYGQSTINMAISATNETYKPQEIYTEPSSSDKPQTFPLTDLGNAERMVALCGDDIRYCHAWGSWLIWDGKRWINDRTGTIKRKAKKVVRNIYSEAKNEDDDRRRRDVANHATKSESASRIKSMISLAQDEEGVPVLPEDLDKNPWLLNCMNGTIDLKTGELLPHNRNHLITKLVPVEYNSNALCPIWDNFMDKIMDDNQNLISFLQRAVGYSLTGDTGEQCMFIFWGTGANGKSTFLQTMSMMLDDYAMQTPTETLLVKRKGAIPNDVARLKGSRFVTASEAETDQKLAEGLIKQMTGSDTISARFLHQEWFDFNPTHKIFLGTNHKPVINGTDNAIWRRIRLVNYDITIPESERDKRLLSKLQKELSGILAWAVRGCLDWNKNGLGEPEEVKVATEDYREEMDILAQFIKDCCEEKEGAWELSKNIWERYQEWCEDNGESMITRKNFGMKLKEKGYEAIKRKQGRGWIGLEVTH
ncbi:DNA primase [Desulfonema limicola]|uniref:DNA primase n=1 Tax=Desulfonema limicola TaxID=45656 RepID=A0A975B6Q6_9BACT|nr:phage/plasmid primase, P4 family [Desulfonema limicola]QTA79840.1 DNA primase [Desulfonema limicola]